jgi:hypothetical protein
MDRVTRPDWWPYPQQCGNGHPWAPGRIIVSWEPCQCEPARAAQPRGSGHRVVLCRAGGCQSVWYQPRHDAASALTISALTLHERATERVGTVLVSAERADEDLRAAVPRPPRAPQPTAEATP